MDSGLKVFAGKKVLLVEVTEMVSCFWFPLSWLAFFCIVLPLLVKRYGAQHHFQCPERRSCLLMFDTLAYCEACFWMQDIKGRQTATSSTA